MAGFFTVLLQYPHAPHPRNPPLHIQFADSDESAASAGDGGVVGENRLA